MNVLQNVMQIIDSISDKIPENVYLALCNEWVLVSMIPMYKYFLIYKQRCSTPE